MWCPRSHWQFKWVEAKPGFPELREMSSSYGQFVYVFSWPSAWSTLWVQGWRPLHLHILKLKPSIMSTTQTLLKSLEPGASVKFLTNVFLSPSQTNVKSLCQVFFLSWHCTVIDLCWFYVSEKQSHHVNALLKLTPSLQWPYISCSTTVTKYCHLPFSFYAAFITPSLLNHPDLVSSISEIIFKK